MYHTPVHRLPADRDTGRPTLRGRARRGALVLVAALTGALFGLPGMPSLFAAFTSTELEGTHRIHLLAQGMHGAIILVAAIALLRAAWRTPAAVHQLLVGAGLAIGVALAAGMAAPAEVAPAVVLLVALVALLPERRSLLRVRPSLPLVGLAIAGAVPLLLFAAGSLSLQGSLPASEPHAAVHHWAGMGIFAITLAALAVTAALRGGGSQLVLWTAGVSAAVWGLASAASPELPSSLGVVGGLALAIGAAAFVALGEVVERR